MVSSLLVPEFIFTRSTVCKYNLSRKREAWARKIYHAFSRRVITKLLIGCPEVRRGRTCMAKHYAETRVCGFNRAYETQGQPGPGR